MTQKKTKKITETAAVKSAPAAKTKVPAQPVATPKKTNTALIVIIVLIVLLGLPALGFGAFWYFVGHKIENVTDKLNNGEVNISLGEDVSLNTNHDQKWPTNLPIKVPEFSAGQIVSSGNLENIWSIMIENASKADVSAYRAAIVNDGWTIESEPTELEGMISMSATKNNYGLNLTLTTDESGKTSLLYTLGQNIETETK